MNIETIQREGQSFVVLPESEYNTLLKRLEDAEDLKDLRNALNDDDEFIPASIVDALLDGNNPLKVWRKYRGLTQIELSEKSGITQGMIAMIERGKRTGTVDILRQLAESLNLDVDDLT